VLFGATPATAYTVVSDTVIVAVAPAGTTGTTVNVSVTNWSGTANAAPTVPTSDDYTFS
jgi:hypothetical protein